ncbi:competence/damage-inducible protein A [Thiorhodococcus mannitoliphagus]|uniref:Competence/damage-inducible protein A n=1 Tax=Thiorhodococcus mannitoliphagus TaxID=329406 RepID=A0A6P1E064_9GAMM|nr:molybdopterin-binding protein [Thiorhodococcus mannitoliphagus]NEX21384.1 competence/damage-inducible protein A [Thiorhodococcus mannitoliphagus]
MTSAPQPIAFGLIVIGDEVLNGDRADGHFAAFKRMIQARGHELAWYWLLPDDPDTLTAHLSFSMARSNPVFCCGGIGATPDDHTRACAAAAAGGRLTRHPGARALLEAKFGADAYPHRMLMADLPEGAELIPNPVNQIPGFSTGQHWFLPGFPKMAWPMAEWVLDRHYGSCAAVTEAAVVVRGTPESRLIPLMEQLGQAHPDLKLFSLPHMGEDPHILLGFRGRGGLEEAMADLRAALAEASITDVESHLGH